MEFAILLALLFVKHYIVDFAWQTNAEISGKGIYGNLDGLRHSLKHGAFTAICVLVFTAFYHPFNMMFAVAIGVLDFVIHYHIDWVKMNYGNKDISNKLFWNHLGMDQLAHQLTYIGLALLVN